MSPILLQSNLTVLSPIYKLLTVKNKSRVLLLHKSTRIISVSIATLFDHLLVRIIGDPSKILESDLYHYPPSVLSYQRWIAIRSVIVHGVLAALPRNGLYVLTKLIKIYV